MPDRDSRHHQGLVPDSHVVAHNGVSPTRCAHDEIMVWSQGGPNTPKQPGYTSSSGKRKKANFVYLSATLDAAIWGPELALGVEHIDD